MIKGSLISKVQGLINSYGVHCSIEPL